MTAPEVDALLAAVAHVLDRLRTGVDPEDRTSCSMLEADLWVHVSAALTSVRAAQHVSASMQATATWPAEGEEP